MDRSTEALGVTDVGIILYRRMLDEQAAIVEKGGEPMNVWRNKAENEIIILPCEYFQYPGYEGTGGPFKNTKAKKPDVEAILSGEGVDRKEFEGVAAMAGEQKYGFN